MGTRDRILYLLKTKGPQSAAKLARRLEVTAVAVRQHLGGLESEGLVAAEAQRGKVGRPVRLWATTARADDRFPDSHGELAVGMLDALKAAFGQQGLDRLVEERTRAQIEAYAARLPEGPLGRKVAMLARIRTKEGYMAESSKQLDGSFTLIENHCPICDAARACQGLCAGEQRLFETVLGARVERLEHALAGDRRCTYRITPLDR